MRRVLASVSLLVLVAAAGDEWPDLRRQAGLAEVARRADRAVELWTQALDLAGDDAGRIRVCRAGRGRALALLGRNEDAFTDLRTAAALYRDAPPAEDFYRYRNLTRLARLLLDAGEAKAAVEAFRQALPIALRTEGESSRAASDLHFGLALALLEAEKPGEAIPHLERALLQFARRRGEASFTAIGTLEYLVGALQKTGRWRDSLDPARRWAMLADKAYGRASDITRTAEAALLEALIRVGRFTEAEYRCRRDLRRKWRGRDAWRDIGRLRMAQGRLDEAEMYVRKAIGLKYDPTFARDLLADIVEKRGRKAEAAEIRKRAAAGWLQEG